MTAERALARVSTGIRHMVVGAFWFSVMSVLVKLAGQRLPSMEIVFFRGVITLGLSYAIVRRAGIRPVLGHDRRRLLQRGVLGAAALACFLFSLTHLPLGEATLIQYMNPIFAILVASFLYGERARRGELLAVAGSLVGVLLVTRPAFLFGGAASQIPPSYALIALMGAAFSGSAYATIRQMPAERPEVVVFYLPLLSVPMALPFMAANWLVPTWGEWALLLGIGATTQMAQTAMTRGLQIEKTARATMTGYTQILFAAMWGVILFGEHPSAWSVLGGAIILVSTLVMAVTHREGPVGDE
ncbi:MAG TPA: DMT family transporter [Gemmatimonadaceae bacterium]|nr:DMT family transporter [Gemmatimonadaceae bacterium]